MKNPTDAGFEQDYNAQVAVDQGSLLIVGWALGGGGRVVSGLFGVQSQALPYLILSVAWGWGHLSSSLGHYC